MRKCQICGKKIHINSWHVVKTWKKYDYYIHMGCYNYYYN